MGKLAHSTHHAGDTAKSTEKLRLGQYDLRNTLSSDDLYRITQILEKTRSQMEGFTTKDIGQLRWFDTKEVSVS